MPTTVVTFSQSMMAYAMGIIMGRYGRRVGMCTAYGFAFLGVCWG